MTVSSSTRLAVFVGGVVLAESAFYAVVPPLVPGFVREVHMTTTEVGILVAAYPAGVLCAAIPSMAFVDWCGVKAGTIVGLAVLVAATLGFAWGTTPLLLDVARLVQGVGGAIAWTSAVAWLTADSTTGRRASVIGGTLGAALIGMVLGPGIGAAASEVGRGLVFSAIAIVLTLLALSVPAASPVPTHMRRSVSAVGRLLRNGQAAWGTALLVAIGVVNGTVAALLPLLVSHRQGSAAVIAAILAVSYSLGALLNVVMGRLSDRFGKLSPTLAGFVVATVILPTLPFLNELSLAVAAVIAIACVSSLWTPTAAMVSDGGDESPSGQAVAVATLNAAWAAGAAAGAVAASWIAQAAGFTVPFALLGGLCALSVLALALRHRMTASRGVTGERRRSAF